MENKLNSFDSNHIDDAEATNNHGWQKVTYAKKQRKQSAKKPDSGKIVSNGSAVHGGDSVFTTLEKQSEERRRRIEAQKAAIDSDDAPVRSLKHRSDVDDDDSESEVGKGVQNGVHVEEKKPKVKKVKKPKVTIAEAAAKIDADDLAAFLADITVSLLDFVIFNLDKFVFDWLIISIEL